MPYARRALVRPVSYEGRFAALGRRWELRSNVPRAGEVLGRLFAAFHSQVRAETTSSVYELVELVPEDGDDRPYELFLDGWSINRAMSPGTLVDWIVSDITQEAIDSATGYAIVHASAAVFDGRTIVLPAPPEHGKTTTVAALVRADWDFLTDEAALIGLDDGLVHPFARPLMISPSSMAALPGLRDDLPAAYEPFRHFEHHVAPIDLRPDCLAAPAPLGFLVFPSYGEGRATELTPLGRGEALVAVLDSCFNLPLLRGDGIRALSEVVRIARCFRLSIGAIEPAVELLEALARDELSLEAMLVR